MTASPPPNQFRREFYLPDLNRILLTVAAAFGLLNGLLNPVLLVFVPLWIVLVVTVWAVPAAVVTDAGIRRMLFRKPIPWREVSSVLVHSRRRQQTLRIVLSNGETKPTFVPASEWGLVNHFVYLAHVQD